MAEATEFPITVNLGTHNGQVIFRSKEEVISWDQTERSAWNWIPQNGADVLDRQNQAVMPVISLRQQLDSRRISEASFPRELKNQLEGRFRENHAVYSKGPHGKFILDLKEKDEAIAVSALRFLQGGIRLQDQGNFIGAILAVLYLEGITGSATPERRAFKDLKAEVEKVHAEAEAALAKFNDKSTAFDSDASSRLGAQKRDFDALLAESREKWNKLESYYREELGLRAPSWYWRDKAKAHRRNSVIAGLVTVAGAALAGWGIYDTAAAVLKDLEFKSVESLFPLGIFLTVVTFAIWFVRILLRIFLSQMHLATDASERRVMTLTYLALIDKLTDADRQIMLQAIFRSSVDGIVRDEGAPASPTELVSRILERGR